MAYMISGFGEATPTTDNRYETLEEAKRKLFELASDWCDENNIDIYDTDYVDNDDYFEHGIEGEGVQIFKIYSVPNFKDDIEEALWKATLEMDKANFASIDYSFSLCDNGTYEFVNNAKELVDKALELYRKEN